MALGIQSKCGLVQSLYWNHHGRVLIYAFVAMHRATASSHGTFIWGRKGLFILQKDAGHQYKRLAWGRFHLPSLSPSGCLVQWVTWITVGAGLDDAFSETILRLCTLDLISYKHPKTC